MPLFEDIDKTETTVFNAAQWIGCGRVYKDVPRYVCDPLQIGDFGFVYTQNAIMAAQGMITNYYYGSSVHATVPSY